MNGNDDVDSCSSSPSSSSEQRVCCSDDDDDGAPAWMQRRWRSWTVLGKLPRPRAGSELSACWPSMVDECIICVTSSYYYYYYYYYYLMHCSWSVWYSVSDEAGGGLFAFHLSMIMNHSLYGGTHDHDALFRCGVMRAMMMCGKKKWMMMSRAQPNKLRSEKEKEIQLFSRKIIWKIL